MSDLTNAMLAFGERYTSHTLGLGVGLAYGGGAESWR